MQMPGMTGLELQRHLKASGTSIPTIFITANSDGMLREQVLKSGALYLGKPFDDEALLTAIRLALNAKPDS
jgi:two-component system response regulator FixJ